MSKKTKNQVINILKRLRRTELKLKKLSRNIRLNNANSRTNQNIVNNSRKMKKRNLSFRKRRSKSFKRKHPNYNQGN